MVTVDGFLIFQRLLVSVILLCLHQAQYPQCAVLRFKKPRASMRVLVCADESANQLIFTYMYMCYLAKTLVQDLMANTVQSRDNGDLWWYRLADSVLYNASLLKRYLFAILLKNQEENTSEKPLDIQVALRQLSLCRYLLVQRYPESVAP